MVKMVLWHLQRVFVGPCANTREQLPAVAQAEANFAAKPAMAKAQNMKMNRKHGTHFATKMTSVPRTPATQNSSGTQKTNLHA